MTEFNLYLSYESWFNEKPDGVIMGRLIEKNEKYIEITDENDYTQILIFDRFFAITFRRGDYLI